LTRFEFESGSVHLFYLYLCSLGESRLLVSWCAGDRCGLACSDEDRGRSSRLQRNVDDHTDRVLGGQAIERSSGTVCGLHHTRGDEERVLLG
jgi:hypothetical protein